MSLAAAIMEDVKRCSHCREVKSLSEFHRNRSSRDGHHHYCKPCFLERCKEYSRTHSKEIVARVARWRKEHPEKYHAHQREADRRRYWRDPETARARNRAKWQNHPRRDELLALNRERVREWQEANPERRKLQARAIAARRYARKLAAEGDATATQIQARIDYYGGKCWMCGGDADTIDHVIALSRGGSNWPANLRPACNSCNARKGNR